MRTLSLKILLCLIWLSVDSGCNRRLSDTMPKPTDAGVEGVWHATWDDQKDHISGVSTLNLKPGGKAQIDALPVHQRVNNTTGIAYPGDWKLKPANEDGTWKVEVISHFQEIPVFDFFCAKQSGEMVLHFVEIPSTGEYLTYFKSK